MRIGVPSEHGQIERRVALTPDAVTRLLPLGVEVLVQAGAGVAAALPDGDYSEAGARIVPDGAVLLAEADLVVMVTRPRDEDVPSFRSGTAVVGMLQPLVNSELVEALAAAGVTSFSLDAIPRITRSQSMDALSSQATVSGYKAVLMSAELLPKFFPMLMTAAGTVAPAKVFVLGAGVAGLQALATARRLGAVVSAFDTRPVVREQVESLGASFVELQLDVEEGEDARGYARELSEAQYAQQQELVARTVADSDVVITTALIPGRPAPRLITAASVAAMRPGSVIVDLAAEAGGNCELTVPGEVAVREGVTIVGTLNLPSTMPLHASQMYARNITNLLGLIIADLAAEAGGNCELTEPGETAIRHGVHILGLTNAASRMPLHASQLYARNVTELLKLLVKDGQLVLDEDDQVIRDMTLTRGGDIVHGPTRAALDQAKETT